MRTYIIILGDIISEKSDNTFAAYVKENKFDWWRYTALNWILLTPDSVSTNMLVAEILKHYGAVFQCVLEINVNDVGGLFPTITNKGSNDSNIANPFSWFQEIKRPNFIPSWEKAKQQEK